MVSLIPHEVLTPGDLESLRWIRNDGRENMRYREVIMSRQQRQWWDSHNPTTLKVWLYRVDHLEVGYGLIQVLNGKWWVTVAVAPTERGKGYGTAIHKHLAEVCPGDLWAEQLITNVGAYKSATAAGFVCVGSQDDQYSILVHYKEGAAS